MNKTIMTILGFLLTGLGILSLILMLFGARFSFLSWIDSFGTGIGFVLKLLFAFGGILLIILARIDWDKELEYQNNELPDS